MEDLITEIEHHIFDPGISFEKKFKKAYHFHYRENSFYRTFLNALGYSHNENFSAGNVPLMPVRAFKSAMILPDNYTASLIFRSSGTSSMNRSRHAIVKPSLYEKAVSTEFYSHFPRNDTVILAFLPKYDENPDSSLIWMIRYLVNNDPSGLSGFTLNHHDIDYTWLNKVIESKKRLIIFGAAFGLIDFMNHRNPLKSQKPEVIETGGMKTHKREISKKELRDKISGYFSIPLSSVHSEYGMCELHSQMYAIGSEWFTTPPWVKVSIRNAENPEQECKAGKEGKIGIIDLANLYSCPFILTNDRGVMNEKKQFKVLGRWESKNMRGCNFLIDDEL